MSNTKAENTPKEKKLQQSPWSFLLMPATLHTFVEHEGVPSPEGAL